MPGPGPHLLHSMGTGLALTALTDGSFSPHHNLVYSINSFFGPDIGSFSVWLGQVSGFTDASALSSAVHHPFYYVLILGLPLCFFYSWVSRLLLQKGLLDSVSGIPLTRTQCFMLVSAGSLSHFFLDHLFEENGHSTMYTWILSTGWWEEADVNQDAVIVVTFLCVGLFGGFIYINRRKPIKAIKDQCRKSAMLIMTITSLYCLWCSSQIYWVHPRRPAVGEEADLGVFVFLAIFFFLPLGLCMMSMNPSIDHLLP